MSDSLNFQLFVGVPLQTVEISLEDVRGAGLEIGEAGIDLAGGGGKEILKYIGLPVGLPVSWDGPWVQGVSEQEYAETLLKVVGGLARAGIAKLPDLYLLVNYY